MILEGLHLDPGLYLGQLGATASAAMPAPLLQAGELPTADCPQLRGQPPALLGGSNWRGSPVAFALEESPAPSGSHPSPTLRSSLQALPAAWRAPPCTPSEQPRGEQPHCAAASGVGAPGQPAPALGAVVVPLVLRMCPEDQGILLPGWAGAATCGGDDLELCERLAVVQARLCSGSAAGVPVFDVRPAAFGEALDALHDYVLGAIQLAASQPGGGCSEGRPTM